MTLSNPITRIATGALCLVCSSLCLTTVILSLWVINFPACEWEDSANCYWDAQREGNGYGTSFYNIGFASGVNVTIYIPATTTSINEK